MPLSDLPNSGAANFESTVRSTLNTWKDSIDGKAANSHTHGAGGVTVSIVDTYSTLASPSTTAELGLVQDTYLSYIGDPSGTTWHDLVGGVTRTYTKSQHFEETILSIDSGTSQVDWNLADNQVAGVTLTGAVTMNAPTNLKKGGIYVLNIKQDTDGSRTVSSWNTAFWFENQTAPTLASTGSSRTILSFYCTGVSLYGQTFYKEG